MNEAFRVQNVIYRLGGCSLSCRSVSKPICNTKPRIVHYGVWPFEVSCRIEGRNSVKRTVRISYLFPLTAMLAWILHKVHPKRTFRRRRLSRAVFRPRGSSRAIAHYATDRSVAKLSLLRGNEVVPPRSRTRLSRGLLQRNESYEMFSATRVEEELSSSRLFSAVQSTYTRSHPPCWLKSFDAGRPQTR